MNTYGWYCSICNQYVTWGLTHQHMSEQAWQPNTWVYTPNFDKCSHCFCKPVDEDGRSDNPTKSKDHKKCCMCPTRRQTAKKKAK